MCADLRGRVRPWSRRLALWPGYWLGPLTYDGRAVGGAGQQVVHDEQEDGVAQDEGHLEGGAVHAVRG